MNYIELEVDDVQSSQVQGEAFALLLKEKGGNRFLPVVIGVTEARAVVFELNRIKPHRPSPHDLFGELAKHSQISLNQVIIWKFEDGVFYAHLIMKKNDGTQFEIDARTSDAVALALKFSVPIMIDQAIFDKVGIQPKTSSSKKVFEEETIEETEEYDKFIDQKLKEMPLAQLQDLLAGAIESEDYELASKIHEEINKKEKGEE